MVAGRSPENAISIPDNSVSRKHLLLRQTPAGWMASDMGSGNGTLLNEVPLREETLLENGDRISLGDTELEFVLEGAPERRLAKAGGGAALDLRRPPDSRRPVRQGLRAIKREQEVAQKKKTHKKLLMVVSLLLLALAGVGAYFKLEEKKKEEANSAVTAAVQERERILNERFQQAKNLVRLGEWADAQHAFQELQGQAPDFRIKEIADYLKDAEKEVPNQTAMIEAQDAIAVLELKEADARLKQVTDTKYQYERLNTLKQEFQEAIRKKIKMANELTSKTTSRESMVKLKAMTDDVLAVVPGHRDATSLQSIALEAIHRIDNPYRPPPPPETPWVGVTDAYKAGEIEEATRQAEACAAKQPRCKKMHSQLENLAAKNRRIENLTPKEFFELYELDKQLSEGAGSPLTRRILLFAIPVIENTARNARLAGRLGEATGLASNLLKIDSKNTTAQNIMREVREQAQNTYMRAYTLRPTQPDQAEQLFKEVLQMLPANEDYAQRAQTQLNALRKAKISADEE